MFEEDFSVYKRLLVPQKDLVNVFYYAIFYSEVLFLL